MTLRKDGHGAIVDQFVVANNGAANLLREPLEHDAEFVEAFDKLVGSERFSRHVWVRSWLEVRKVVDARN